MPHRRAASLIGISALLWIINAAVTCASNSGLMLMVKSVMAFAHRSSCGTAFPV
ncbi:MAG: hypothetical protein IPH06_13655 [Alphaproteobacteria bacterium]|nr:hypothetical protein [Alphaproteobacteria bacterium]